MLSRRHRGGIFFGALALLAGLSPAARAETPSPKAPKQLSAAFQWQIVEFFSAERCDLVRGAVKPAFYPLLRANILAIVAFCEPTDADPETLFAEAEKKDPSGDLIMVLHAKYAWKQNPEKALPLWEKVLKHARNSYLKTMAKRYLGGQVEKEEALHLSAVSFQGNLRLGGGFESNPLLPLAGDPATRHPQAYSTLALSAGAQRWLPFGSLAATYAASYDRYLATPDLSLFQNQLEVPLSLRLGTYEDLVFRPLLGLNLAGRRIFETRYGMGVLGVAYRPEYKQSVQGMVYFNRLLFPEFRAQEGTHFRFEYNWEFFPSRWTYRFQGSMEHVQATHDFSNGTDLKLTHTDIGGLFGLQVLEKGITYALDLSGVVRLDSLPSEFYSTSGLKVRKRRNDFALSAKPGATIPLGGDIDLGTTYEFSRTFSSMGPGDYTDYNVTNHKLELVLHTEFSNY